MTLRKNKVEKRQLFVSSFHSCINKLTINFDSLNKIHIQKIIILYYNIPRYTNLYFLKNLPNSRTQNKTHYRFKRDYIT